MHREPTHHVLLQDLSALLAGQIILRPKFDDSGSVAVKLGGDGFGNFWVVDVGPVWRGRR